MTPQFSQKLAQVKNYLYEQKQKIDQSSSANKLLYLVAGLMTVVALFAGVLGYKIGERQGKKNALIITNHKNETINTEDVKAVYLENEILKTEVATLVQERDISLNNLNLVRDEVQELKSEYNEINALNEALANADPNDKSPAQVLEMEINSVGGGIFEYRFDVLISSTTDKKLVPTLTLLNATSLVDIPLTPKEFNTKGVVNIQGKFTMPNNFTPNQVKLMLNIDKQTIVKLYNWQVGSP